VATAPIAMAINASVVFIFMPKCMLSVIKNMKTPQMAIMCMLALNLNNASIKQANVETRIPTKK
jgi:hypothetical protein